MNPRRSRRAFLADAARWVALAAALPLERAARAADRFGSGGGGPEPLRVAVVGLNGYGMTHVKALLDRRDAVVAALCDPDPAALDRATAAVEDETDRRPKTFADLRDLFDHREIDAVIVATPNHWNALAAIWAMASGHDVYVEKPVSHNVFEAARIEAAAARYGRIVQAGYQYRSRRGLRDGLAYLRAGELGRVLSVSGIEYKRRDPIGRLAGRAVVPGGLNLDLWLGPAPRVEPHRVRFHHDWHWFWDYGNGPFGIQAAHLMDLARWGLGRDDPPRSAVCVGGRFGFADDGQTPNTSLTSLAWEPDGPQLLFEIRELPSDDDQGVTIGVVFRCERGVLVLTPPATAMAFTPKGKRIRKWTGDGDHLGNWLDAVRARDVSRLACAIGEGGRSDRLGHFANLSYRLGDTRPLAPDEPELDAHPAFAEALDRMRGHLKADGFDPATLPFQAGRPLQFDPATGSFGSFDADRLLTRLYRAPYVVP